MRPYTFFKHDGRTVPPSFELDECEDDDEAREHARLLLSVAPKYTAIEVWDGVHAPFTVERNAPTR